MSNNKSKKQALVTGGAGFIGSHTVEKLLNSGYGVRVIDNFSSGNLGNLTHLESFSELEVLEKDITQLDANESIFKGVDFVFHFAGQGEIVPSIQHPMEYIKSNLLGTVKTLEAARHNNIGKFVYAASSSCYGAKPAVPTNEDSLIQTAHPYALSKYLGELAVFHWNSVYNLPANSIRIFNAYGPRSRTSGSYGAAIGVFLKQKLSNKPFTVVGDGEQLRDFVYVTDVAAAFLLAAETNISGRVWNLGSGNPVTINKLISLIQGDSVYIPKRPAEPEVTWADTSRIKSDLNWKPEITIEVGMKTVLEQIDYWQNAPLWDPENISKATEDWFKFFGEYK